MINPIKSIAERVTSYRMQNDKYLYGVRLYETVKTPPTYWRSDLDGRNARVLKTRIPPIKAIIAHFKLDELLGRKKAQTQYSKYTQSNGTVVYKATHPHNKFIYAVVITRDGEAIYGRYHKGTKGQVRLKHQVNAIRRLMMHYGIEATEARRLDDED